MRKLKNWLLPLCTCLAALALALLPQRLSQMRDRSELSTVHTETLESDNNLPMQSLALEERVVLLSRWFANPDFLASVVQELYEPLDLTKAEERTIDALEELLEDNFLLSELVPDTLPNFYAHRLYLRGEESLSSATFLVIDSYDKEKDLTISAALDEETGKILRLMIYYPKLEALLPSAAEIGEIFLDYLEISYLPTDSYAFEANFLLPGYDVVYMVSAGSDNLSIDIMMQSELRPDLYADDSESWGR